MTTDEIRARLFAPSHPLTPERFAKAKALALRSKRPAAFLELLEALPEVDAQMVEHAHTIRVQQLQRVIADQMAQPVTELGVRMLKSLQASVAEELETHIAWKARRDESGKIEGPSEIV